MSKKSATKRFLALARVSSREQEREGFSLDVQVDALNRYAERAGGSIVKLFRVAETASKSDERKAFREMLAYARTHAGSLDGILVYKVDRAARNLFDYVELERLESVHDVPLIAVSQPTESTPAGRMQRRMLASMASFYTEQQSLDVKEGMARRAQSGLFVAMTPYGYRNERVDGRSLVKVDEQAAANVRLIFELYAHQHCTIDGVIERLREKCVAYRPASPNWSRSKVHTMLRDRAYIGEVRYRGQWLPGSHPSIVDKTVWNRVQALLGANVYRSHGLLYAGELIRCGHCGSPITGESIEKPSGKRYVYYRCSQYRSSGHPPTRLTENQLDEQVVAMLGSIQQPESVRDAFAAALRDWCRAAQSNARVQADQTQRELSGLRQQQDRLLNLRLLDEIDADTFAQKQTELRDRIATATLNVEAADRSRAEQADLTLKVFELSQSLTTRWLAAEVPEKRQILELICLNFSLNGVSLAPTMRKPFDVLAEGLFVSSSRGDRI